ncbi:bcr-associated protein bap [Anaeramoeba ignava]|uniref:Endoplasmic reticulum transmembrane protein n=1 Tax=Anaeramoeba ignava TaxID=1746090 RepID=A0A9Q0LZD1_ANAIG|nr:bcr-associated protein bap [Anaeramoeba ignava]
MLEIYAVLVLLILCSLILIIFLAPFIPKPIIKITKSFLNNKQISYIFKLSFFLLLLMTINYFLEMRKFDSHTQIENTNENSHHTHADSSSAWTQSQIRKFRIQRNFYLCEFTLALQLITYRMLPLMKRIELAEKKEKELKKN